MLLLILGKSDIPRFLRLCAARTCRVPGVVEKLTSKIDLASAKSAELKGEVKTLSEELAALAKEQASSSYQF